MDIAGWDSVNQVSLERFNVSSNKFNILIMARAKLMGD